MPADEGAYLAYLLEPEQEESDSTAEGEEAGAEARPEDPVADALAEADALAAEVRRERKKTTGRRPRARSWYSVTWPPDRKPVSRT